MKIHWENGPRLYNNATDVSEDMRKAFSSTCHKKLLPTRRRNSPRAHAGTERTEIDPHGSRRGSEIFIGSNVNTILIELTRYCSHTFK